MSELVVGSIAGLAANSYEVGIASGSTLDLANAKAGSLPDTALSAVPGMKHIVTTTATPAVSVSLDNVFSADYNNYRIVLSNIQNASITADLYCRLRSNSTDASSVDYSFMAKGRRTTGVDFSDNGSGTNSWKWGRTTVAKENFYVIDICNPYTTNYTSFWGGGTGKDGTSWFGIQIGGMHLVESSYDGFTLLGGSASSIGMTISVYGYVEA